MSFSFLPETQDAADKTLAKYPIHRRPSGLLPLLMLAQKQNGGWLSDEAISYVAEYVGVGVAKALEVVTFYTMFHQTPVGKNHIQVCTNISCWLRGSDNIERLCTHVLGITPGETTKDGLFSLERVECLGACTNAPAVQINEDYYENLEANRLLQVIEALRKQEKQPSQN